MSQLEIAFHPSQHGREVWKVELDWARRCVTELGAKEVCYWLDIAPSTLSEALAERDKKALKGEWVRVLVMMAPQSLREEWLRLVAGPMHFVVERRKKLTPEQELRAMKRAIAKLAPGLEEAIETEVDAST